MVIPSAISFGIPLWNLYSHQNKERFAEDVRDACMIEVNGVKYNCCAEVNEVTEAAKMNDEKKWMRKNLRSFLLLV
jgi:hypothetical protein